MTKNTHTQKAKKKNKKKNRACVSIELKFVSVYAFCNVLLLQCLLYFFILPDSPHLNSQMNIPCSKAKVSIQQRFTVKILKIGTPKIITVIVLQMEQLDFTVQYCVQKMQTE